jgi:hypothetical protein
LSVQWLNGERKKSQYLNAQRIARFVEMLAARITVRIQEGRIAESARPTPQSMSVVHQRSPRKRQSQPA